MSLINKCIEKVSTTDYKILPEYLQKEVLEYWRIQHKNKMKLLINIITNIQKNHNEIVQINIKKEKFYQFSLEKRILKIYTLSDYCQLLDGKYIFHSTDILDNLIRLPFFSKGSIFKIILI